MKRTIFFSIIVVGLITLSRFPGLNSALQPRTIYVKCANGSGGSASNAIIEDGSLARPYSTVTQGYSAASPGDTLVISGCRYYEKVTFTKPITVRNECGTVAIGTSGDAGPQDFVLTTGLVPVVQSGSLFDVWNDVTTNSLGVAGEDPIGKWIYQYPAKGTWFPLPLPQGEVKQTLCGKLQDFWFYNEWWSGDEADWNLDIIPSPRYSYILEEPKKLPNVELNKLGQASSLELAA